MTDFRKRNQLIFQGFLLGTALAGGLFVLSLPKQMAPDFLAAALLFVPLIFATELLHLDLPRGKGTMSVSFGVVLAVILLYEPGIASVIAAIGTIRPRDLRGKVPLPIVLFNRGQVAIATGLGGLVYHLAAGHPHEPFAVAQWPAIFAAGFTYYIVNMTFISTYLKLNQDIPFFTAFGRSLRWAAVHQIALIPVGMLLAMVYRAAGAGGAILFFVPLLIARYSMQRYTDLRTLHMASIRALVRAIDARDHYTRGHSERVAAIAAALGRQLKLRDEDLDRLEFAGLLHDVGKIGISDEVLLKPTSLTTAEYDLMKTHPVVGANIIAEIRPVDEKLVQWVRWHHERPDGKGYPDALPGDAIPRGASILGVADALDAIMTDRPYKRGLNLEQAVAEIKKHSGTQFHPEVVNALEQAIASGSFLTEEQLRAITGEPTRSAADIPQIAAVREAAATAPTQKPVPWAGESAGKDAPAEAPGRKRIPAKKRSPAKKKRSPSGQQAAARSSASDARRRTAEMR